MPSWKRTLLTNKIIRGNEICLAWNSITEECRRDSGNRDHQGKTRVSRTFGLEPFSSTGLTTCDLAQDYVVVSKMDILGMIVENMKDIDSGLAAGDLKFLCRLEVREDSLVAWLSKVEYMMLRIPRSKSTSMGR